MTGHEMRVYGEGQDLGLNCACGAHLHLDGGLLVEQLVALQGEHYVAVLTGASTLSQQPAEEAQSG